MKKSAVGFLLLTGKRWGQRTILPLALALLRRHFYLDLGTEGADDLLDRRQRHPSAISPSRRAMLGCCMPTRRAISAWVQPFFNLARIKLRAT